MSDTRSKNWVAQPEEVLREALRRIHRRACGDTDRVYMSIPAEPNKDADLILAGAISELIEARARIKELETQK